MITYIIIYHIYVIYYHESFYHFLHRPQGLKECNKQVSLTNVSFLLFVFIYLVFSLGTQTQNYLYVEFNYSDTSTLTVNKLKVSNNNI